jgi:osmotically-inducible protein OsmY
MNHTPTALRTTLTLAAALLATWGGTACAPLLIGSAVVGSGLVVTDRRTTGTQVEDQGIELKAAARVRELATLGRISVTSYNRVVLISGEVPTEADRSAAEVAVAKVENVRSVVNELAVGANASVGTRSNDTLLSTKVKATLVDAKDVQANAFKIVTERGIVYMMGRVSEREATRGSDLARAVPGVQKVVRVFEVMTEQELAALGPASASASSPR